jgi:predicted PhzF superfamily epimerase YddE/YHI9
MTTHDPQIISVGLPFLVLELSPKEALRRAKPNLLAYESLLPLDGADAVFAYVREEESENAGGETTQGVEMGRPSVLLGRTIRDERGAVTVYVGGRCVSPCSRAHSSFRRYELDDWNQKNQVFCSIRTRKPSS